MTHVANNRFVLLLLSFGLLLGAAHTLKGLLSGWRR